MTDPTNFPELLSTAIIYSLATGAVCYTLLRVGLLLAQRSGSLLKYHLSNACLVLTFAAFLWPFKDLHLSKTYSGNIGQQIEISPVRENRTSTATLHAATATKAIKNETDIKPVLDERAIKHLQTESLLTLMVQKVNERSNIILTIYLVGLLFFSFRLLASYMYSQSLKRTGISDATEQWLNSLQFAMSKLNMTRDIRILFSSAAIAPCIIGHSKAVILIPITLSTQLSTEQAEAILLHELAHLKHYDYYINIAMQVINCFLFFNPFVWLTIKKCKQYREQACDEITTREERSLALAESLSFIAENTSKLSALTLMLKESKYKLLARVQNLLGGKQKTDRNYSSLGLMLIPLLLSVCMILYSTNIFSQKKDDLKTRLEKVSQEMFDEGNERFIVVDAILDSLFPLPEAKEFRLADTSFPRYSVIDFDLFVDYLDTDKVLVNNHPLRGKLLNKYSAKISQFLAKNDETYRPVFISFVSRDTPKLKDIFDPNSDFRDVHKEYRARDIIFTKHRKKIIEAFLDDKLLDPNSNSIAVSFEKKDLEVNGMAVPTSLRNKYRKLFETEIGTNFNDIGYYNTSVWNLPCTARDYLKNVSKKYTCKKIPVTGDIQKKLRIVSEDMYKQGNEKYVIVDAIIDNLLPLYEMSFITKKDTLQPYTQIHNNYEVNYNKKFMSVNYTTLSGEMNDRYTRKMKAFLSALNEPRDTIDIRTYYGANEFTLSSLLNAYSPVRKVSQFSRWDAGIYTQFRKQVVQNLVADHIILPSDDTVNVQCYSVDTTAYIKINSIPLSGPIKAKYVTLFESSMGKILHHNHLSYRVTWEMPGGAEKYIQDLPVLKNGFDNIGFNDPLKSTRDKLVAVSRQMFDEGNEKYIIVDAIIDSLLPLKHVNSNASLTDPTSYKTVDKIINFHYMGVYPILLNGKPLTQGVWNAYVVKMMKFHEKLQEPDEMFSVSYKNDNGLSLAEILEPNSAFRKLNLVDRREAGFYTLPRKKMVKHMLEDKLISPTDDKLSIAYSESSVSINDKALSGKLKTKYLKLLVQEYGADLHHSYSGVWNMKDSAKEYISDLDLSKKKEVAPYKVPVEYYMSQLPAISQHMFDEGNEKYAIVDAIMDSLVGLGPHYEMLFMSTSAVSLNAHSLNADLKNKYAAKMEKFATKLGEEYSVILVKYKSDKALSFEEIFDPSSPFRKLNIVDRNAAGIRTMARRKMVRHFLDDKLIAPTDDKLDITYGNGDIIINDKVLTGAMKKKYYNLLQNEYGVDLSHDAASGVWNMTGGAKTYIQGIISSKKNDDKKTGSNFPDAKHAPEWAPIPMSHIAWRKRCWKDIDVTTNRNSAFGVAGIPSDKQLYNILVNGVKSGKYKAYATKNDKFTNELTDEEFRKIVSKNVNITKFRIKEDSLFFKREDVPGARILGLAPIVRSIGPKGEDIEAPLFWLYYAGTDVRNYLAQNFVYNNGAESWYDVFENARFYYKTIKESDPIPNN